MNNFISKKDLYFNNRAIEIIQSFPSFNLAIVKYIDTLEELTVDINFITNHFSQEHYITINI